MSVDIDLDFIPNLTREETANERERLTEILKGYMSGQGYSLSDASRFSHSLDAFHYNYVNAAGNKDMIKIEINYSLRTHVLPSEDRVFVTGAFGEPIKVRTVAYVSIINIRYNWKRTLLSVITNNTTVIERSFYMRENKLENFVFTVIMAFLMVYAMICYNIALNIGGMKNTVFLMAFHELIIMWPVAIILEMFIMEKPVMTLTSRVVTEEMPFFFMLLARCALTVCLMCPAMSLVATFLFKEYHDAGFVSVFLQTAAFNFPMALCWQIFFAGPAGRWIFRALFRRKHTAYSEESAL